MEDVDESRWPPLGELFDIDAFEIVAEGPDAFEIVAEGPVSYVTRASFRDLARAAPVAIKSASTNPKFSKQPHDIGKELRILMSLSHFNVIDVLGYTYELPSSTLHYWMPYVPLQLHDILSSPEFSPYTLEADGRTWRPSPTNTASFIVAFKSILYQTLSALAHVHANGVAHRDIKPHNLLLSTDGCVKLIDFGVAWSEAPDPRDLWPEAPGSMCFDVATGPYRAPELLFGARSYDACGTDLWSLGAVLAEFFTPLRLCQTYGYESDEDDEDEDKPEGCGTPAKPPFIIPKTLDPRSPDVEWERDSLYDASRGQIGLAFSIFKVHGTPNEDTWPAFKQLPDAQKVNFVQVPPVDLRKLLPNLPPEETLPERQDCFDVVSKLLVYPPEARLGASASLTHPLFARGSPVLVPPGYPADGLPSLATEIWEGRTLADVLAPYSPRPASRSDSDDDTDDAEDA